jgi:hypothetical protein
MASTARTHKQPSGEKPVNLSRHAADAKSVPMLKFTSSALRSWSNSMPIVRWIEAIAGHSDTIDSQKSKEKRNGPKDH